MIFITGDTHADWVTRLNSRNFPQGKDLTKSDYVIICGDFGYWHNTKEESVNLHWLNEKPWTTLFIDGNHSNFDRLDALPQETWNGGSVHRIRNSVIHLMRGQVFTLEGKTFFTFGGAKSHDISDGILEADDINLKEKIRKLEGEGRYSYRINHKNWWERELPSAGEMAEGLSNLYANENSVDYIITHCCSFACEEGCSKEKNVLTDYFEKIRKNISYNHWFFGHYHIDKKIPGENATYVFENIVKLTGGENA